MLGSTLPVGISMGAIEDPFPSTGPWNGVGLALGSIDLVPKLLGIPLG